MTTAPPRRVLPVLVLALLTIADRYPPRRVRELPLGHLLPWLGPLLGLWGLWPLLRERHRVEA